MERCIIVFSAGCKRLSTEDSWLADILTPKRSRLTPDPRNGEMRMRPMRASNLQPALLLGVVLRSAGAAAATVTTGPAAQGISRTNISAPASTPAKSIFDLSLFVLAVTGGAGQHRISAPEQRLQKGSAKEQAYG